MDWIDSIGGAEFLRKLFSQPPSLHGVRVIDFGLQQDGPRVLISFDLNEYPDEPPAKWVQAQANRVQIRLMGIGVRELELRGWSANNIADIKVTAAAPDAVALICHGDGFFLKAIFDHLAIDRVSAYRDETE
ncbi:Imm50 family immunity protein [Cystobacter fuscus]